MKLKMKDGYCKNGHKKHEGLKEVKRGEDKNSSRKSIIDECLFAAFDADRVVCSKR